MEKLGLSIEEMMKLKNDIYSANQEQFSKLIADALSKSKTESEIFSSLVNVCANSITPLVLVHIIEANNVKVSAQLQEYLEKK